MKKLLLILLCLPMVGFGQTYEFSSSKNVVTIANGKSVLEESSIIYWFFVSKYVVHKSMLVKYKGATTKSKHYFNEKLNYIDSKGRYHYIREDNNGKYILDLTSLDPKITEIWWDKNKNNLKKTIYYINE